MDSLVLWWAWRPEAVAGIHWQEQQVSAFGQRGPEPLQTPPAAQPVLQKHTRVGSYRSLKWFSQLLLTFHCSCDFYLWPWSHLLTFIMKQRHDLPTPPVLWGTARPSCVLPTSAVWATSSSALPSLFPSDTDDGRGASTSTSRTRMVSWPDITMTCTAHQKWQLSWLKFKYLLCSDSLIQACIIISQQVNEL